MEDLTHVQLQCAVGHFERGTTLQRLQRLEDALSSYDAALRIRPDFPECLNNRGTTLRDLQRQEEALASYDAALALRPHYPAALNNKGLVLLRSGRLPDAARHFKRAIELRPDYPLAWSNLGLVLRDLGRLIEALAAADRAVELRGDKIEPLFIRGSILMELARPALAALDFRGVLESEPHSAGARSALSNALLQSGRPDEAAEGFELLSRQQPQFDFAAGDLLSARLYCCDWSRRHEQIAGILDSLSANGRAVRPFQLLSICDDAATQLACAKIFAAATLPEVPSLWRGERYRHEKIRIAYLSPDFREHALSYLMAGVFEQHDRGRFETLGVSLGRDDRSATAERVRGSFGELLSADGCDAAQLAGLLRAREIDIAIDLQGFTSKPRGVLAYRVAPVQVNYLGFPGSLGSRLYDYLIADEFVVPAGRRGDYAEKVVYMPDCFQANDNSKGEPAPACRQEFGLAEDSLIFASFNHCHKITETVFAIWMRLLVAVPSSILWILAESRMARQNLRQQAAARAVDPDRLVFAERVPYPLHLARLRLADLFLDTLPFNGGTTLSDALWAGVPVVSCAGGAFAARMGGSLLRTVGLPELTTHSSAEYESLALTLALNPSRLAQLRARLDRNRRRAPLFDTVRFCRHLEAAYTTMWQRAERGAAPEHFSVTPISPSG
jgi:protein O-GlcNAc transferase